MDRLTFWKLVKKKISAEGYNAVPHMCQLVCRSLWVFYGFLVPFDGLLIITVNSVGVLSQIIYVIIYLVYAPMDKKISVIKTRSVEYMPFIVSLFLLLNAAAWFAFAMFLMDLYIIVPNVIGIMSGIAQLIIYMIYKKKSSKVISTEMAEVHEEGINVEELKETSDNNASKHTSPRARRLSSIRNIMRTISTISMSQDPDSHSSYILVP
ncbi:bidirectional sugar transporter SWEET12-like [Ipomoea triloba]|uniref:bidirectional sugar transporter SWEET12-like n=1 Tax=Ipomoea triloba TaxID=35885 RepID=UPI00125DC1EB|nr:bidirectional sugar transporter SWEET12-like [Ipomoea triloba]